MKPTYTCKDDLFGWDLDKIHKKRELIEAAVQACEKCPALVLCSRQTRRELDNGLVIQGVVQAGYVWLPQSTNSPKIPLDVVKDLKLKRKIGTRQMPAIRGPLERNYV